jgi:hypothetical protein
MVCSILTRALADILPKIYLTLKDVMSDRCSQKGVKNDS